VTPRAPLLAVVLALALSPASAVAGPADLDPSFGGNGIAQATPGRYARLSEIALTDAGVVATGYFDPTDECVIGALVRWRAGGTLDESFGNGGVAPVSDRPCESYDTYFLPESVTAGPAGRLLTAGRAYHADFYGAVTSAHRPDGAFDPAFGTGGVVRDPWFGGGQAQAVLATPDGRVAAAGHVFTPGSSEGEAGTYSWQVDRYLPDGTLDPSFDGDGHARYALYPGSDSDSLTAAAADVNGAIVAVGTTHTPEHEGRTSALIARIESDGSLDPTFGEGGRVRVALTADDVMGQQVAPAPGGGYLVTARANDREDGHQRTLLLKLDGRGRLDPTFGSGGIVEDPAESLWALAVDAGGRTVLAGADTGDRYVVARYLVNGAIDETFGEGGRRVLPLEPAATWIAEVPTVAVQPDGRIVLGATAAVLQGTDPAFTVVRLLGDRPSPPATGTDEGTIGGGPAGAGGDDRTPPGETPSRPEPPARSAGGVTIRIVSSRITRRGVLVRVAWPRGTDGTARARLWTRNKGILLGQRAVPARRGTTGRRFRVPLNRRAKRLLRSGRRLKVLASVRVTGLPPRARG
jgi:uncharacterized delta-60 repeat protein